MRVRPIAWSILFAGIVTAVGFAAHARAKTSSLTVMLNLKSGEQVGDIFAIKADVFSEAGISKVEFSVDDQLKSTVTKAPYEYRWDTVDEIEGEHSIQVAAYDAQGKTASKRVRVEVDNELSLGVKPHADRAIESFRRGEFDKALLEGRKAYKINIADLDAIRALAAGVGGKGDHNRAIDLLEKVQMVNNQPIGDPKDFPLKDPVAMELRGRFRIERAEKQPNASAMLADLAMAYDFWRKLYSDYLTGIRKQYPESDTSPRARIAVGDALFYHGEYASALEEYRKVSATARERTGAQNRAALAMIRLGRDREAESMVRGMIDLKTANDATRAIYAALLTNQRKYVRARAEAEPGVANGSLSAHLVASHADIGTGNARRSAESLRHVLMRASATPDAQYLAASYFTIAKDLKVASTALFAAMRMDPGLLDIYAMRALQLASLVPGDGMTQAQVLFDFVLDRDPRHVTARLGKAILLIHQKKWRHAEPILKELSREEKESGDVWLALAAAHAGLNNQLAATEALKMAGQVDMERFGDQGVPLMPNLIARVCRYRRPVLLTPYLLQLEETGGSAVLPEPKKDKAAQ